MSKQIAIAFAVVIVFFGLIAFHVWDEARPKERVLAAQKLVNEMVFVQEVRTGLCFGVPWDKSPVQVPCEQVRDLIKK